MKKIFFCIAILSFILFGYRQFHKAEKLYLKLEQNGWICGFKRKMQLSCKCHVIFGATLHSIDYYNKNSKDFFDRTINADLQEEYQKFLKHVPDKGRILDAGCGVGRDSKFFISKGYEAIPFDGSIEMVRMASNLLGKQVLHLLFQGINFLNEFHAVWANASLLHIPYENLRGILCKFHNSLMPSGILYASFKYGTCMRQVEGRFFFDMNEETIKPYLKGLFQPLEIWKSADTRSKVAPSPDKSWLNFIAKRIEI